MSELASTVSPRNTKIAALSVIVTAISGIIIACVGVLPKVLEHPPPAIEAWEVDGTLTDSDGNPKDYHVLLVPKRYETYSDDKGKFTFDEVEPGNYFIVIRNASDIKITSIKVSGELTQVEDFETTRVSYSINQQ